MLPVEPAGAIPLGVDATLLQLQMGLLALLFGLVCASMWRGSAFHDDGWHLVRRRRRGAAINTRTLTLPASANALAAAQPMVLALFFSTYLRLQGLHKGAKDSR